MAKEKCELYRITPFDDTCVKMRLIFDYFLYRAPSIDSSFAKPFKEDINQQEVASKLIADTKIKKDAVHISDRRTYKIDLKELESVDFSQPYLYCHKRSTEGQAECVLRHCRNALAHGNVFVKFQKNNTRICFQDLDVDRNTKKKKASALIVVTKASLERWMRYLEELVQGDDDFIPFKARNNSSK